MSVGDLPYIYDIDATLAALRALPPLRYVDGLRVAYTLPDGRDVLVSPAPGAVPIVRWLTTAETTSGEVL